MECMPIESHAEFHQGLSKLQIDWLAVATAVFERVHVKQTVHCLHERVSR